MCCGRRWRSGCGCAGCETAVMADRAVRVAVFTPDFPPAHGGIQHLAHRLMEHVTCVEPLVITIDQTAAADFDRRQRFAVRRSRESRWRAGSVALLNLRAVQAAAEFRPDVILNAHIVTSP